MRFRITNELEDKITMALKCVVVVMTLLTAVTVVNTYMRDVYKLLCIVCVPWGGYLSVKHKLYKKIEWILLACFVAAYLCTIALSRAHIVNEIAMVGYMCLLFFMTLSAGGRTTRSVIKEIDLITWCVLHVTFVYAACSFFMFLFSIGIVAEWGKHVYVFGMYQNRLWGVFNPNTGAMLYLSGILSAMYLWNRTRSKVRARLYMTAAILEALTFVLCQSRGTWVCMSVFLIGYVLFVYKRGVDIRHLWSEKIKFAKRLALAGVTCILLFCGAFCGRVILSYVPGVVTMVVGDEEIREQEKRNNRHNLQRIEERDGDINSMTTGRAAIWKMGLEAYKTSPVFGIGFRSIDDAFKKLPKEIYLNSHMGGLHNSYLTVLVSGGAVGLLFFLAILGYTMVRGGWQILTRRHGTVVKCIYIAVCSIVVAELVESRIMFSMDYVGVLFWLCVGYITYFCRARRGEAS